MQLMDHNTTQYSSGLYFNKWEAELMTGTLPPQNYMASSSLQNTIFLQLYSPAIHIHVFTV